MERGKDKSLGRNKESSKDKSGTGKNILFPQEKYW